jgi:hypothetical protein
VKHNHNKTKSPAGNCRVVLIQKASWQIASVRKSGESKGRAVGFVVFPFLLDTIPFDQESGEAFQVTSIRRVQHAVIISMRGYSLLLSSA